MNSWGLTGQTNNVDRTILQEGFPDAINTTPKIIGGSDIVAPLVRESSSRTLALPSVPRSPSPQTAETLDSSLDTPHDNVKRRIDRLLDDTFSTCFAATPNSFGLGNMTSGYSRQAKLLAAFRRWLDSSVVLDVVTVSWCFLITYELAFTTALLEGTKSVKSIEILSHLRAADNFLGLIHTMDAFASTEVSRFVKLRQEFDHRLKVFVLLNSAGYISTEIMYPGWIFTKDQKSPSTIRTRSGVTINVQADMRPLIDEASLWQPETELRDVEGTS